MRKYGKTTPEGFGDLLFEECAARRLVEKQLRNVFESKGFHEVVTSGLEYYDVFSFDSAYMPPEGMYKLVDLKGRLLVLRPDSTVPIARIVSTRLKNMPLPVRLFYNQDVYRINPSLSGRSDEIVQSGIELIGAQGLRSDLEVILTAIEALETMGGFHFRLELGHIGLFNTFVSQLPLSDEEKEEIRFLIQSKNFGVLSDRLAPVENSKAAQILLQLPKLFGSAEILKQAAQLCGDSEIGEILSYLDQIYSSLSKAGYGDKIILDLGLVPSNVYYTGIVFQGYVEGLGVAALSGGRYDRLLRQFGDDLPAVGFAVSVDILARSILKAGNPVMCRSTQTLIHAENGYEMAALSYADALRREGVVCENSIFSSLEKTMEYALAKQIPTVVRVGAEIETISIDFRKGQGQQ